MSFVLMNAPSIFQRIMHAIFREVPFVRAYLDVLVVFSSILEERMEHVLEVLKHVARAGLKLKVKNAYMQNKP